MRYSDAVVAEPDIISLLDSMISLAVVESLGAETLLGIQTGLMVTSAVRSLISSFIV